MFSNNDNNDVYDRLKNALEGMNQGPPKDFGFLGYTDSKNKFSVYAQNRSEFRVRLDDGTNIDARHNGRVSPIPDLPVEIRYDRFNQPYIYGVDDTRDVNSSGNISAQAEVGPHSHHRNSGMEFPIDMILVDNFQPLVVDNWLVQIGAGWYFDGGTMKRWNGSTIDLKATADAITTGNHNWVMATLNKTTLSIDILTATEKNVLIPLLKSDVEAITPSTAQKPLFVTKVRYDDTQLYQQYIESLAMIGEGNGASDVYFGEIVTAGGDVVTVDGKVLWFNSAISDFFFSEDL